jgi:hypothetical protein
VYRVVVDAHRPGSPAGSGTTALLVGGADLEMSDPRVNVRVLQRLASVSGGRMVHIGGGSQADSGAVSTRGTGPQLVDALRAAVPAAAVSVRRDLWHTGWSFAAIVLLLGAEWLLRRKVGLR